MFFHPSLFIKGHTILSPESIPLQASTCVYTVFVTRDSLYRVAGCGSAAEDRYLDDQVNIFKTVSSKKNE